jgi:hypothetical protein
MLFAWVACALGLAFGAGLGARALLDPHWAQKLVRLKPDEQGGGFAEFRATYGGLFFAAHALALVMLGLYVIVGEFMIGVAATGATAVLSAAWGGTAFGRALAIWRDGADTKFNRISLAVEALTAAAIGAPWIVWVLF